MESRTIAQNLLRHQLGAHLRRLRHQRGERLTDTARRAGISPQYLSEIERGLKDPSSEMLAAIVGALEVAISDVVMQVGLALREATTPPALRVVSTSTTAPHPPATGSPMRPVALVG